MTDLDKLIEAVEAGKDWPPLYGGAGGLQLFSLIDRALLANGSWDLVELVPQAYRGSLDAAKSLHEVLVPNMRVQTIYQTTTGGWCVNLIERGTHYGLVGASADNPARAWLLAILKAWRSQQ